jgi:ubiquinone/menaquinone biosynthesis C-methylase UbiE
VTSLPRATGDELMDEPGQDAAELARSLADLRGVNRWLGGTRIVLRHLSRLVAGDPGRTWRILDVATGSADIPLAIARWASSRGIAVEVVATDLHPTTLEVARARIAGHANLRAEAADALDLRYPDSSFDVVLCSTALHHFNERDEVLRVLREMDRVARVGGIVNDLRRSRPALVGANLLAATVWRTHPVTRHDGPLSVRRSFTPSELRELGAAAGLRGARVHAHVPFRVALVWRGEG